MAVIKKTNDYRPTHKALTRRMSQYLKGNKHATVVFTELSTSTGETPDVIGWFGVSGGQSILIECKVSRSDFLADQQKSFRLLEESGVGDFRYFAAPCGVISPEEIPEGWGLFEVTQYRTHEVVKPAVKPADKRKECLMLISALRRLEISTAVFVREENDVCNDCDKTVT